jgi:hypothetical protein
MDASIATFLPRFRDSVVNNRSESGGHGMLTELILDLSLLDRIWSIVLDHLG